MVAYHGVAEMKILITGDPHLRTLRPKRRVEADFMGVCLNKLEQVLGIACDNLCEAIIVPGDVFDRHDPSKKLIAAVIELLGDSTAPVYAIHGQHDMAAHAESSKESSALRVLEATGFLSLVDKGEGYRIGDVKIIGASWGALTYPINLRRRGSETFDIYVGHEMVGDKQLWPGHELTGPQAFMKKFCEHPYDLYILGDYHYAWQAEYEGSIAINAGCLIRKTADKRDRCRTPKVVVFDTDTRQAVDVPLDVPKWEDCFDLTGYDEVKPDDARLDQMAEALRQGGQVGMSFNQNLMAYYEKNETPTNIREAIAEAGVV